MNEGKRKRLVWPVMAGLVVGGLLILVIWAALGSGTNRGTTSPAVDEAGSPVPTSSGYTLEAVSKSGRKLDVMYSNGKGGIDQKQGVQSGWTLELPDTELVNTFTVSSTVSGMSSKSDTLTCRVKKGDEVISESQGEGQYASASCTY